MTISISDDFDLKKIQNSGQAFRIRHFDDNSFRFVYQNHILYIKEILSPKKHFDIKMYGLYGDNIQEEQTWDDIWKYYFDLNRSYSKIRSMVSESDSYMRSACENGEGLRILKQDPWEMLITFIISQRKSIPAIKQSVESICEMFGKMVETEYEQLYLFPSAKDMIAATQAQLKDCKLGYRVSYIQDAVIKVASGELALNDLYKLSYEDLFEKLKTVRGVGDKVSNCICLFAYAKTEAAPVDTWIKKVIDQYYAGNNPFPSYKKDAGIMQQYIFYYAQTHKDSF